MTEDDFVQTFKLYTVPKELSVAEKSIGKRIVQRTTHSYTYQHQEPSKRFRNLYVTHHVEGESTEPQTGFYQLSNPRISQCKNFFDEDFALVENPGTKLGVARLELSDNHKLNLHKEKTKEELVGKLFGNQKTTPQILIFE